MSALGILFLLVAVGSGCFGKESSQLLDTLDSIITADREPPASADEMPDKVSDTAGSSHDKSDKIVGGEKTTIEEHPYQISFIIDKKLCGGFIISEDYIVTAAHCVQNGAEPGNIELRAGSTFRRNGTVIPIAEVAAHPQYNSPRFDKDVAVLKTAEKINFTDAIQAIPLASEGRPMKEGSKIVISGWGRARFSATTIPERLWAVEIPVVNNTQCSLAYTSTFSDNQFCAGNFFLGGQGTCQGDSGGGVVQDGIAVGIVSYGRGCGQPLSPSVFADIASKPIRQFIKEKTGL